MAQFKRTVVFYPLCILAIWLPCVFLGVAANALHDVPRIAAKLEARQALAAAPPTMPAAERAALRRQAAGDDVILLMLERYAPLWLAGLLGAGIMAAVMASDSQILALSTMFTEDVFTFYGGTERFGEAVQVQTGRAFVVVLTIVAYAIALRAPQSIFDLAVQYAFSGYAALSPLLVAALFWKRSTKWGALAVTLWVAAAVIYTARVPGALAWYGLLPVVPMTLISCVLMVVVSLLTPRPSQATLGEVRVSVRAPHASKSFNRSKVRRGEQLIVGELAGGGRGRRSRSRGSAVTAPCRLVISDPRLRALRLRNRCRRDSSRSLSCSVRDSAISDQNAAR